ncbi:hypothetical protein B0H14DRAFT_2902270 [Mycena olivaceomarginata]|nr:hypothetical protein B0H14DRAFT_2902270 [Mycena olivaceomarginata]
MWLNRSGCYPLSLDFSDNAIDPLHPTELLSAVVVPRCARWERLDLQLSLTHLRTIHGPMPLLRSLCLEADEAEYDVATKVDLFQNAPLLRTATLNDIAAARLILPWAQLMSLTLYGVYPRECVPILQHTLNLVDCHLHLVKNHTDGIPDVTLPSLQSLTLRGEWVTGYLETLIVPALRHLQIPEPSLEPHCIETLASFISKAGCKPQNLCLTYTFPSMMVYFVDG